LLSCTMLNCVAPTCRASSISPTKIS
jgi:hypothetical protein